MRGASAASATHDRIVGIEGGGVARAHVAARLDRVPGVAAGAARVRTRALSTLPPRSGDRAAEAEVAEPPVGGARLGLDPGEARLGVDARARGRQARGVAGGAGDWSRRWPWDRGAASGAAALDGAARRRRSAASSPRPAAPPGGCEHPAAMRATSERVPERRRRGRRRAPSRRGRIRTVSLSGLRV